MKHDDKDAWIGMGFLRQKGLRILNRVALHLLQVKASDDSKTVVVDAVKRLTETD